MSLLQYTNTPSGGALALMSTKTIADDECEGLIPAVLLYSDSVIYLNTVSLIILNDSFHTTHYQHWQHSGAPPTHTHLPLLIHPVLFSFCLHHPVPSLLSPFLPHPLFSGTKLDLFYPSISFYCLYVYWIQIPFTSLFSSSSPFLPSLSAQRCVNKWAEESWWDSGGSLKIMSHQWKPVTHIHIWHIHSMGTRWNVMTFNGKPAADRSFIFLQHLSAEFFCTHNIVTVLVCGWCCVAEGGNILLTLEDFPLPSIVCWNDWTH